MSAYVVSREHIRFLVESGIHSSRWHRGTFSWVWSVDRQTERYERGELPAGHAERAAEVGRMLWEENIRSVMHRYPNCARDNLPGPCDDSLDYDRHSIVAPRTAHPLMVLKAIACFEYQSCEHPGWEESEAKAYCRALRHQAIAALPGYEDARWEIDDADAAFMWRPSHEIEPAYA